MAELVTAELMKEWVEGILQEWLDGQYTEHLDDGHQRHVKRWSDDVYIVRKAEKHGGKTDEKKFRIKIEVEEVF